MNKKNQEHEFWDENLRMAFLKMHNTNLKCYCHELTVIKPCSVCCENYKKPDFTLSDLEWSE